MEPRTFPVPHRRKDRNRKAQRPRAHAELQMANYSIFRAKPAWRDGIM